MTLAEGEPFRTGAGGPRLSARLSLPYGKQVESRLPSSSRTLSTISSLLSITLCKVSSHSAVVSPGSTMATSRTGSTSLQSNAYSIRIPFPTGGASSAGAQEAGRALREGYTTQQAGVPKARPF